MNGLNKIRTRLASDRWLLETVCGLASLTAATLGVLAYAWLIELRIELLNYFATWALLATALISVMLIVKRLSPPLRLAIWPLFVALGLLLAPWFYDACIGLARRLPTQDVEAAEDFAVTFLVVLMAAGAIAFVVQLTLLTINVEAPE